MSDHHLTILTPGLHTLIVDEGRPRSRSLGVPVGGAADRWALAIGNALVGNPPHTAALEVALAGPTVHAACDLACVVYGAPFEVTCSGRPVPVGHTFTLPAGMDLRIGGVHEGMRACLCIRGGVQVCEILGSRSGLAPVRTGDRLGCVPGVIRPRSLGAALEWNKEPNLLRVLDSAQADWFDVDQFCTPSYTVTPSSNRMGLRLQGPSLTLPPRELVSEPVCPGAVQVTRDGQCIILGVDGQTIGGYPKIVQVISADLDKLAQLRPGAEVRFQRVGLAEAERLHDAKQKELNEWLMRLRTTEPLVS